MAERSNDGMTGAGLPWASVFDPVANARALEQIQRRGLQAAGDLVDRLVAMVDGARDGDGVHDGAADGGHAAPPGVASAGTDLMGVWAGLVTQTLQAMTRLSVAETDRAEVPTGGPVWVDVVTGRGSGSFALQAEGATAPVAAGELWLHNVSRSSIGPLRLHVGELRSSEGVTVPAGWVRLDPEVVPELPARSCRGVRACIGARDPIPPGRYRGLLQADGADDVAVPVELTVVEPG